MKNGRRNGGSAINRRDLPESRSQFQFSRPSHLHRRTFIVCHRRYHVGAALRFLVIFASRSNEAGAGVSASNLVSARSTEVKLAAIGDPECPRFTTFRFLFSPLPSPPHFQGGIVRPRQLRGGVTPDNISVYNDKKQTREITRGITEPNNMSLVSGETEYISTE